MQPPILLFPCLQYFRDRHFLLPNIVKALLPSSYLQLSSLPSTLSIIAVFANAQFVTETGPRWMHSRSSMPYWNHNLSGKKEAKRKKGKVAPGRWPTKYMLLYKDFNIHDHFESLLCHVKLQIFQHLLNSCCSKIATLLLWLCGTTQEDFFTGELKIPCS